MRKYNRNLILKIEIMAWLEEWNNHDDTITCLSDSGETYDVWIQEWEEASYDEICATINRSQAEEAEEREAEEREIQRLIESPDGFKG